VSNFKDRRSVQGVKTTTAPSQGTASIGHQARRLSTGARSFSEFFAPEYQRREIMRGEFLNLIGMIEYQRSESRWWRRIWRFLMGDPQVSNLIAALVDAHRKTLEEAAERLRQMREEAKAASAASPIVAPSAADAEKLAREQEGSSHA